MLSIICPVYNEEKYIENCIKSILAQDYDKKDIEVLFVDGMSTDHTREIISSFAEEYNFIRLLDNHRKIVPVALNIGIKESVGQIIIRLDAHSIFPKDYFTRLIKNLITLRADNVGGICQTLPAEESPRCIAIANVLSSRFGMGNSYFRIGSNKVRKVDTVPFGCFNRVIFDKIGYFDEDLIRNQDDEFNGRIIKNGGKIYLIPDILIKYFARDSIRKVFQMFYQYGLFKPLVNKKLGRPATIRQFFPLIFVIELLIGPFFWLISNWFIWLYLSVLALYITLTFLFSLQKTHKIIEILIQSWVYFVVHFSYGWGYLCGLFRLLFNKYYIVSSNH